MADLAEFFSSDKFMPHGMCYLWKPSLVWSMVFSEVLIALAYFSIPLSIVYFLSRRKDVRHLGIFYLFAYFIASCGLTHVMDVWIIWHPNYWLQDVLLMSTAMISVWTAVAIWRAIPDALRIPTEEDLNTSIANLKQTVDTLNATRKELVEREKQSALGALVAGLAHELNTPLGNALTIATTLAASDQNFLERIEHGVSRKALTDLLETQKKGLALLLTSLQRSNVLIDQFKLLAVQQRPDQFREIELTYLLQHQLTSARDRYPELQLRSSLQVLPELRLHTDPAVLGQVVSTLLGFVQHRWLRDVRDGCIDLEISAHVRGQILELCLSLPRQQLGNDEVSHVFDPFLANQMHSRQDTLGMHIVFQLVERVLQGTMRVESDADQGTRFYVSLPLAA